MNTATSPGEPASKPRVLLVDDEQHVREAVGLVLERRGFGVTGCADALEALEQLRQGCAPDVILLDLMLPHMDGWEFRICQRRIAACADIPVLVLSADHSPKAEAIDADGYLPKPVDHQQLVLTVERLIEEARQRRAQQSSGRAEKLHLMGTLAGEIAQQLQPPVGLALVNLQLVQRQASELETRLKGADAFSLVGVRQLLQRAQRTIERVAALIQGTAAFAQLAATRAARPRPRVLIVTEASAPELFSSGMEDEYDIETSRSFEAALRRIQSGAAFDVVVCELTASDQQAIEFYRQLRSVAPTQAERVVFMVAGVCNEPLKRFLASARRPHLRRPFVPAELRVLIEGHIRTLH